MVGRMPVPCPRLPIGIPRRPNCQQHAGMQLHLLTCGGVAVRAQRLLRLLGYPKQLRSTPERRLARASRVGRAPCPQHTQCSGPPLPSFARTHASHMLAPNLRLHGWTVPPHDRWSTETGKVKVMLADYRLHRDMRGIVSGGCVRHCRESVGSGAERAHLPCRDTSLSWLQKCVCGTTCITDVTAVLERHASASCNVWLPA